MRNLNLRKSAGLFAGRQPAPRFFRAGGRQRQSGRHPEIEQHGKFEICGEPSIMASMDALLSSFVAQNRMKLSGKDYNPCYSLVEDRCA